MISGQTQRRGSFSHTRPPRPIYAPAAIGTFLLALDTWSRFRLKRPIFGATGTAAVGTVGPPEAPGIANPVIP